MQRDPYTFCDHMTSATHNRITIFRPPLARNIMFSRASQRHPREFCIKKSSSRAAHKTHPRHPCSFTLLLSVSPPLRVLRASVVNQSVAKEKLHQIWMADTRAHAHEAFDLFVETYQAKYPKAAECLNKDREELLAFYDFPAEHWVHLRTTEGWSDRERLRDREASTEEDSWQRQSRRLPRDGLQVDRVRQQEMANAQRLVPLARCHSRNPIHRRYQTHRSRRLIQPPKHNLLTYLSPGKISLRRMIRCTEKSKSSNELRAHVFTE